MSDPVSRSERVIELRVWQQFVAVAEHLHFGRAALSLHMTQPPLTQAIAALERQLDLRLFDRTKRSVRLTPAGVALLPEAQALLSRAAALPLQARAAAAGELGRLRLGFVSTVGYTLLPRWVRAFRLQHPRIALELVEATGDLQLQALERGEMDAGFLLHTPDAVPPGLTRLALEREALVLALPQQHALALQASPLLSDVLCEPLVLFPRRILPSVYDAIVELYHRAGRQPLVAQEAIQMQTIVNLVSAQLGLAWVPDSVRQFQRSGVVYREVRAVRGQSLPWCETSLVWSAEAPSPALQRFIDFVQQQLRDGVSADQTVKRLG